ncbi:hypothetical protein METSCH_A01630 [Metschnikowia aff. pulcherrima]|uniref:WD-like domain-containing protein n=1 Tax=Metschnikowia aff. pulcherrima TaxID=2163413 RepID=A0A4P6XD87_9ASCO|nr:hypothetical protein METSCH_A01630 [Metschnikowia aff. pulcherrima]
MRISTCVFLIFVSSVAAKGYTNFLTELSTKDFPSSDTEGDFTYTVPEVPRTVKRSGNDDTELINKLAQLPSLNIHSFDNVLALTRLSEAATAAYIEGSFGDFFYLWEVMYHNGYSSQLNDMTGGELRFEIEDKLGTDPGIFEVLARSLTVKNVREMYLDMKKPALLNIQKRDTTKCNTANRPDPGDCSVLESKIRETGYFNTDKTRLCHGRCCVSWSTPLNVTANWVLGKFKWCEHHCINAGFSCKIKNMRWSGRYFNFCYGSTAGCKR